MKAGRFVQVGTAQQIVGSPADDYVAAFTQDIDRARVFTGHSVVAEAHALDLATDTPASAMERMARLARAALHVLDSGRLVGTVTSRGLSNRGAGHGRTEARRGGADCVRRSRSRGSTYPSTTKQQ